MMKTGKKILILSAVLLSLAFAVFRLTSSHAREESLTPTLNDATRVVELKDIQGYKTWARVHPEALRLPAPLDMLCVAPTRQQSVETSRNPHRQKYFVVYVNEAGRQAMMSQLKPVFPAGSIIVKEKLLAKDDASPELLTVMTKREKGFNEASGDWEYMVVNGERTKIESRGNLENCRSCHLLKSETDYVFRSYLPDEARQKLQ
ncbi:MAG: cytochrome P460 family protein [Pyrinomonadaceae bacterium]